MIWPRYLDLSEEDCKKIRRKIELQAYSSLIDALRIQGNLTDDRKELLSKLQEIFQVSAERHRAEIRRSLNDEVLFTVAYRLTGVGESAEWLSEGRRVVPLLDRLPPKTAFSALADKAAVNVAERNLTLPPPEETARPPAEVSMRQVPKYLQRPKPKNNECVLTFPGGTTVHLGEDPMSDHFPRKRRRSEDSPQPPLLNTKIRLSTVPPSTVPINVHTPAPRPVASQPSKVIFVSNSTQPSSIPRPLPYPVVRNPGPRPNMPPTTSILTSVITSASTTTYADSNRYQPIPGKAKVIISDPNMSRSTSIRPPPVLQHVKIIAQNKIIPKNPAVLVVSSPPVTKTVITSTVTTASPRLVTVPSPFARTPAPPLRPFQAAPPRTMQVVRAPTARKPPSVIVVQRGTPTTTTPFPSAAATETTVHITPKTEPADSKLRGGSLLAGLIETSAQSNNDSSESSLSSEMIHHVDTLELLSGEHILVGESEEVVGE